MRTEGIVDKIREKFDEFKTYSYNIDAIAQRSAINSDDFDDYGLYLQWNYSLWMQQYLENIKTLNGMEAMGDMSFVGRK